MVLFKRINNTYSSNLWIWMLTAQVGWDERGCRGSFISSKWGRGIHQCYRSQGNMYITITVAAIIQWNIKTTFNLTWFNVVLKIVLPVCFKINFNDMFWFLCHYTLDKPGREVFSLFNWNLIAAIGLNFNNL